MNRPTARCVTIALAAFIASVLMSAAVARATKKPPLVPVNLNTANSEQLQTVPGIGPATAEKILQMRKSYGPFKSVDDLLAIRGIGKKRLEKIRKYLTVGHNGNPKPAKPAEPQTAEQPQPPSQ